MFHRAPLIHTGDHENVDSGAETAESDFSRMSLSATEVTRRLRQQRLQSALLLHLHLLANPGDSLLLQQTLDQLLRWLCPSLRVFHVSERASPYSTYTRLCPVAGYPSVAITFFLHEAYGEERILKVLDFFQHPPWQYHHTESCGSRTGGVHISSCSSPAANPSLRPYLLPSRDFYSLGAGMPVWGVRPVHCGGEILRVTLYSAYDNYQDSVRLYETVLQRQAEEQKSGFCWFTLHTEPGLSLQLAIKQLSPEVRVEPCNSAVLQFNVEEIGQLVPLLPNPCTPISLTRWQTEDLDGNKVLFQVKTLVQRQRPLTCAFPLSGSEVSPRGQQLSNVSPSRLSSALSWHTHRQGHKARDCDGGADSFGSGSGCSSPPGSSCYSSQRSSPASMPPSHQTESPLRPHITRSLSHLLLEEDEEETNVDTGDLVSPPLNIVPKSIRRSSSVDLLMTVSSERPAAVGASAVEVLAKELSECLPRTPSTTVQTAQTAHSPKSNGINRTNPDNSILLSLKANSEDSMDEFYI